MVTPVPILPTPDLAAREAFMRVAFKAGFNWCGRTTLDNDGSHKAGHYTHVYLNIGMHGRRSFLFVEHISHANKMIAAGGLVNSPRHFISQANRLIGQS